MICEKSKLRISPGIGNPHGICGAAGSYFIRMLNQIETVTVTVSAHCDDSYRTVERCAQQQWADILARRGHRWVDAGLHVVDHHPDTDIGSHLMYRFEGTTVEYAIPFSS